MPQETEWESRSVQGSSGSYRISVPRTWAEDENDEKYPEIERRQTGDYLIARPAGLESSGVATVQKPLKKLAERREDVEEWSQTIGVNLVEVFVQNLLQSYLVSGLREIRVDLEGIDEDFSDDLREAFEKCEFGHEIKWDDTEDPPRIRVQSYREREEMFDAYVEDVKRFLNKHLIRPLLNENSESFTVYATNGRNHSPQSFRSDKLDEDEDEIDNVWGLTSRESTLAFLDLERGEFAREFGSLYITTYLEIACDIAERTARSMAELEDDFNENLSNWIKEELIDILSYETRESNDIEMIHESLDELAKDCYRPSEDINYLNIYFDETIAYMKRVNKLEKIRRQKHSKINNMIEDDESLERAGILVGQIFALTERFIRFPRTIAQAGLGVKLMENAHGLGNVEKQE